MRSQSLASNPLRTRQDFALALETLIDPVESRKSPSGAKIPLYDIGVHYQDRAVGLEGFSRSLYGLIPYILGGFPKSNSYIKWIQSALIAGTSRKHPDSWGDPFFYITSFIEMGAVSLAILLLPQLKLDEWSDEDRSQLIDWLVKIRDFDDFKNNNQLYFRLFTFMALRKLDDSLVEQDEIKRVLQQIDRCYTGGGWYNDGLSSDPLKSFDYYNSMGFHFYSLLYCQLNQDVKNEFSKVFLARAREFAQDFIHWFDQKGRAVPFGRSLTYRSAQGAFWAALAFASEEGLPWGQLKSVLLNHMRYWLSQPIFSESGLMTVGYAYPNLNMSEEYNSQCSPYWALKPFLVLALGDDHQFWQAQEEPVMKKNSISLQKNGRHILHESDDSEQVILLNSGCWRKSCFQHIESKCSKFSYSSHFGFNVSTANGRVDKRAPDNTLLFTDDGYYFKERGRTFDHEFGEGFVASSFSPWGDVEIRSWLCFLKDPVWQLRIHRIQSARELTGYEGGFSLPRSDLHYSSYKKNENPKFFGDVRKSLEAGSAMIQEDTGFSGVYNPLGVGEGQLVYHSPNSNVIHSRVVIPVLKYAITASDLFLATLILSHPTAQMGQTVWSRRPSAEQLEGLVPSGLSEVFEQCQKGHI